MSSNQTAQRHALQDRIGSIEVNEASARDILGAKSIDLALTPTDSTLQREVESLERELAGYANERQRINLALAELERRDSAEGRRQRLKSVTNAVADVERLGKRAAKVSAELVRQAEALGPLLSELDSLLNERAQHTRNVIRNLPAPYQRRGNTYAEAADWRRGVVDAPLAAALWRAGLGRLGPDLSAWLSITSVREHGDRYMRGDLRALLDENIANADARLSAGMRVAVQSLEAGVKG